MSENSDSIEHVRLLLQHSRFKSAELELYRLLANNPNNSEAYSLLALCYARQDKRQMAIRDAKKATQLTPYYAYSHYILSIVCLKFHRVNDAKQAIEQAIHIDSQQPDYFSVLASIELKRNQKQDALTTVEKGLAIDPNHIGCLLCKTAILLQQKNYEAARITIHQALKVNPENAKSHEMYGVLFSELGQDEEAIPFIEEALRLDPQNPGLQVHLKYLRDPNLRIYLKYLRDPVNIRLPQPKPKLKTSQQVLKVILAGIIIFNISIMLVMFLQTFNLMIMTPIIIGLLCVVLVYFRNNHS